MNRRYAGLVVAILAGIALVSVLARRPRRAEAPPPAPPPAPVMEVSLVLEGGAIDPETVSLPKGHRLRFTIVNREAVAHALALAGYEDRVTIPTLAPGDSARGSFLADRPGEAFAWMVDGQPRGRLAVTGSHLEEGHR